MQTTHKIGGPSADGYAKYLTALYSRGEYYTDGAEDGESDQGSPGPPRSRWHGPPALLASLGLAPGGEVARDDLVSLMGGRSPADGSELRPVGAGGSRVAGIDLTFSAPTSVSALWAVSEPDERAAIEQAHSAAMGLTLARTEREVSLVRTRQGGEIRNERAAGMLAAELLHTSSRLTRDQEQGGVPDPQLHSHVVLLGAKRRDGRFAAVDSRELFRSARVNGAFYRAELAAALEALGLEVQGQTGRDGRYFELAGVPAKLVEQWSARSADIERAAQRFRARFGRDPRAGEPGALTVATRGTKAHGAQVDVNAAWPRAGRSGFIPPRH